MPGRIILLRHGQTYSNISRLLDTRPPGAELTERGRDGEQDAGMEGGETLEDVLARYQPVLEGIAAQLADDHYVILVSHGAAIRVVTKHATGVDADFAYTGYLPNCRFMVMEPRGKDFGQWTLTRWADTEL